MSYLISDSNGRTKILQRILNLRAKAENSGSSESEMNTALVMAMKLMDSYNIEEAELALAEAKGEIKLDVITKTVSTNVLKGIKQKHKILFVLNSIAEFTETKVVFSEYNGAITFTGHRPDIELADFLVAIIKEALDREYSNYCRNTPARGYGAKTSFQHAMASRVSQRLRNMAKDRVTERNTQKMNAQKLIEQDATASSTALIVVEIAEQKAKEVNIEFAKAHPRLRTVHTGVRLNNGTAFGAGKIAGDNVNLGRAISQRSTKHIS